MNEQLYMRISRRIFELIAIATASYNAYLSWFKDEFSLFLLILTLSFSMLAILIQQNMKKRKNTNGL
jgi:hypothetical protein